jgi:peptidoglycan/LPS O-acetylase OafA/YrhL
MVHNGSVWTVQHYFWIDLAIGPAFAMLLVGVATGRPASLVRLLATRPVRRLGSSSYSLYLIHLPIVTVIIRRIVEPHRLSGQPAFWLTVTLAVPTALLGTWLFASVFEIPFQRHRSWAALRTNWWPLRRSLDLLAQLRSFVDRRRRGTPSPHTVDRPGTPDGHPVVGQRQRSPDRARDA